MDAAAEHLKRINLFDDKYFAEVFDAKTWDDGAGAYELERKMRVRRNAEFMKSLGLGDGVKLAAPKPFAARAPRKKAPAGPKRRSPRTKSGGATYTGMQVDHSMDDDARDGDYDSDDSDDDDDDDARAVRRPRRAAVEPLTDAQRAKLAGAGWVAGFEKWLRKGDGRTAPASKSNIARCMPQVKKLAAGAGIKYYRWNRGDAENGFLVGASVDMSSDLIQHWHDGKDHEARYGKDLGNGWVLNHPLKKLVLYQWHLNEAGGDDDAAAAGEAAAVNEAEASATDEEAAAEPPKYERTLFFEGGSEDEAEPEDDAAADPLVGRVVRKKFPGCGTHDGKIVGRSPRDDGAYLVYWAVDDLEIPMSAAAVAKHLIDEPAPKPAPAVSPEKRAAPAAKRAAAAAPAAKRAAEKPAAAAPKVVTPPKRKRAAACVASYKEPSRRQKLRNDGTWTKDGVKTRA